MDGTKRGRTGVSMVSFEVKVVHKLYVLRGPDGSLIGNWIRQTTHRPSDPKIFNFVFEDLTKM